MTSMSSQSLQSLNLINAHRSYCMSEITEEVQKQPLWLPKGSVRSILALMYSASFVLACFISTVPKEGLIALGGLVGVVVTHYFRSREESNK